MCFWRQHVAYLHVFEANRVVHHPGCLLPVLHMQVIPPEEINVSFDDIGALEAVKNTLHEVRGLEPIERRHVALLRMAAVGWSVKAAEQTTSWCPTCLAGHHPAAILRWAQMLSSPFPPAAQVVILPLQRPELFMRGALTKPTKGARCRVGLIGACTEQGL